MLVVCDASPLIFLAKANRLSLIMALFPGRIVALDTVVRQLLHEGTPAVEAARLKVFLDNVERPSWAGPFDPGLGGGPSSGLAAGRRTTLAACGD